MLRLFLVPVLLFLLVAESLPFRDNARTDKEDVALSWGHVLVLTHGYDGGEWDGMSGESAVLDWRGLGSCPAGIIEENTAALGEQLVLVSGFDEPHRLEADLSCDREKGQGKPGLGFSWEGLKYCHYIVKEITYQQCPLTPSVEDLSDDLMRS